MNLSGMRYSSVMPETLDSIPSYKKRKRMDKMIDIG